MATLGPLTPSAIYMIRADNRFTGDIVGRTENDTRIYRIAMILDIAALPVGAVVSNVELDFAINARQLTEQTVRVGPYNSDGSGNPGTDNAADGTAFARCAIDANYYVNGVDASTVGAVNVPALGATANTHVAALAGGTVSLVLQYEDEATNYNYSEIDILGETAPPQVTIEYTEGGPEITAADSPVASGQAGRTITGSGFAGAAAVTLADANNAINAASFVVDSDGQITYTAPTVPPVDASPSLLFGNVNLAVDASDPFAIVINPASGFAVVTAGTINNDPAQSVLAAAHWSTAPVTGDQAFYPAQTDQGGTLTIFADGTFAIDGNPAITHTFTVRIGDQTDSTWGAGKEFEIPPALDGFLIAVGGGAGTLSAAKQATGAARVPAGGMATVHAAVIVAGYAFVHAGGQALAAGTKQATAAIAFPAGGLVPVLAGAQKAGRTAGIGGGLVTQSVAEETVPVLRIQATFSGPSINVSFLS